MCEKTFKFFKLKPQLYEFELSKRLEIKWKSAIEEPIPMFLTSDNELIRVDEDANTVDCKLERNYKQEKGSTYNGKV
ncbi:unnamed protein product [Meloidogyne enterolobii]|uniref:Uncharacterized protein n=1 Tax=Meloidogyne enterolobii TaxID=390850 RepID=A0ACB1A088_MELEN